MSRFFSSKYDAMTPYTPGEQPQDKVYTKLNTNESPFPPVEEVMDDVRAKTRSLHLYCDPNCVELRKTIAGIYNISPDEVVFTNGSDDALNFCFMAFCDEKHPAVFADITYGFYPVFANLNFVPYTEIPLEDDLTIDIAKYFHANGTIFIANPNAPTGIALTTDQIEQILQNNPDNIVVVDEAYVDFGADSMIPFINKYNNLIVIQTFSKFRSFAGGRLGYAVACKELINDLNTIRYSTNPYNINSLTMAAGIATLEHNDACIAHSKVIQENRAYTVAKLKELGFEMTESKANFIFARSDRIGGEELYLKLKDKGVLIRHLSVERIRDYNRITIGSREQMDTLIEKIKEILG